MTKAKKSANKSSNTETNTKQSKTTVVVSEEQEASVKNVESASSTTDQPKNESNGHQKKQEKSTNDDKSSDSKKEEVAVGTKKEKKPLVFVPSIEDGNTRVRFNFPLYALSVDQNNNVIVGGGGGTSKTGIPNKVILLKIDQNGKLAIVCEHEEEDAVKCCAIHENTVACGIGSTCVILNFDKSKFSLVRKFKSDFDKEEYAEQKAVSFLPKGQILATGGSDQLVRLWKTSEGKQLSESQDAKRGDINQVSVDPSGKFVAVTTQSTLRVFSGSDLKLLAQVPCTEKFGGKPVVFKGVSFLSNGNLLVGKVAPGKRSWLSKFSFTNNHSSLTEMNQQVAHRNYHHNVFSVSPNNKFVATGTAENTIGLFELESLFPLYEFQKIHTFFVTQVAWTKDSKFVLSASADYSVMSHAIEKHSTPNAVSKFLHQNEKWIFLIVSLLILLFAIWMMR